MKFLKRLAFVLSLLILLWLLAGCTPKNGNPGESTSPSGAQDGSVQQPESGPAAADRDPDAAAPGGETGGTPADPSAGSSEGTEEVGMDGADEDGLPVESGYTYEVDDNLGVGGN